MFRKRFSLVTSAPIVLFLCFPVDAASNAVKGHCSMDACDWIQLGVPETIRSDASGALKKLEMTYGSSTHPNATYDKQAPIDWGAPSEQYIFCSNRHPAVISLFEGKWLAHLLAPGYPAGVYGFNVNDYIEYFRVCHSLQWSYPTDTSLAEKLGYPQYLVKTVKQVELAKPEDVMALPDYQGSVELVGYRWRKGGFDNVMIATFTIENDSPVPIKDIGIDCQLSAESGTVLGHATNTIYQIVPANGRKTVTDFNMGFIHSQTANAYCELRTFKKVT